MNAGKRFLARIASGLADGYALVALWKRLHRELKGTRSDYLDRAFLATKQGRMNMPPYVSLRQ